MASFNNPKVTNPILTDVPEITSLLQILAKRDYTGATDIPVGAERTTDVTGGKQVQRFNGTSWVSIGKLMHDADTLDSYHASKSALPNTIPVYNDSAQLVGGITGNSATATKLATARTIDIGGIASATEQSFDGSTPITIPINSINVNNEEDTALVGIVSKDHGGTGRNDGAASDIILSNGAKASEYGQIGDAVAKAASVDVDSLVNSGIYHTLVNGGIANNHPVNSTAGGAIVRVYRQSTTIHQVWRSIGEGLEFTRYSTDSGASWSGWKPVGGTSASSLIIYISKAGSDLNTGLDSAYPVLSINRALEIANELYPTNSGSSVTFRVGDGDWGSLDLRSLPYYLVIEDYNATTSGVYSENYPVFSSISLHHSYCELRNIVSTYFYSQKNSAVFLNYYIRAASIRALDSGVVWINTSNLDIVNESNNDCALMSTDNSIITVSESSVLNIIENLSFSDAFLVANRNATIALNNSSPFNVTSGVSVIGKPYNIYKSADLLLNDALELADIPGNVSGSISFGAKINGIPYGGGATNKFLNANTDWISSSDSVELDSSNSLATSKAVADAYKAATTVMTGATDSTQGKSGIVPAPLAGDQDKVLKGDGTWAYLSGMPIGTIFWSASATPVDGAIICNGATPLIATYPDLYAVIGTRYGGDGVTTFGVPNMIGRVAWGATTPGTYLEAGLPNVVGGFSGQGERTGFIGPTGAFYGKQNPEWGAGAPGSYNKDFYVELGFDASRCSSVYGNSTTVQPPALTLVPYIKAYDTVQNVGSMDAAQLASEINRLDGKFGDYLPTSGGTMKGGSIELNANTRVGTIFYYDSDGYREVGIEANIENGDGNGAALTLRPSNSSSIAGSFSLGARTNRNNVKWLSGDVSGTLTWNGKNIVRSVNGVNAGENGNVSLPVFIANQSNQIYLPAGGTWNVLYMNWGTDWGVPYVTTLAGGAAVPMGHSRTVVFAIRMS